MTPETHLDKRIFWIYLSLLGLISILLAGFATSTFGAGVGTDGAIQMSVADNLLKGIGFFDFSGTPFIRWPPLYPVILASLSRLTGLDTFTVGWYLNVLLMGVIVWLGGALLYDCFKGELLWAFLGSLVVASSVSLLSVVANIGTDPLFMALIIAFLLVANRYLASGGRWSLFGMAILACLSSLQRLPGVTLIATGGILIVYFNRKDISQGIRQALLFTVLTSLPLAAWVIGHNYLQYKSFFGVNPFVRAPLFNLYNVLNRIVHWFVPYIVSRRIPPLLLTGIFALGLVLISRRQGWIRLRDRLFHPPVVSSLVFSGVYIVLLVFTVIPEDTKAPFYDRYHIAILVPVLVLVFTILQELVIDRVKMRSNVVRVAIIAIFAVWLIYPVYSVYKYVELARVEGDFTYNLYNTRAMRQSKIVRVLQEVGNESGQTIYSNYVAAAWFYTREKVFQSPHGSKLGKANIDELLKSYQGWPWDKPGYLVWFLPNDYKHVFEPQDLARVAELELIYKAKDGEVYRVIARSP